MNLSDAFEELKKPFSLGQNLQVTNIHQEYIAKIGPSACQLCDHLIIFNYLTNQQIKPEDYFNACLKIGAVNSTAFVLDHQKMLAAYILISPRKVPEIEKLVWRNRASLSDHWLAEVISLLRKNIPVRLYVMTHFLLCIGWEVINGETLLKLCDTWITNETHMNPNDKKCFRFDDQGQKIFSNHILVAYGWYE